MPGKEDEGQEIMHWMGSDLSRDTFIHIMEQYRPDAHVGKPHRTPKTLPENYKHPLLAVTEPGRKRSLGAGPETRRYEDINRPICPQEVSSVRKAAEEAGLWRFCDPVRHEGFNI